MSRNEKIGVLILAAGSSSRLGTPKQLITYRGRSLLQRVIDLVNSLDFCAKILVLGANYKKIASQIEPGDIAIVLNEHWKEGLASSIRTGVESSSKAGPDHLLILLSDQPLLTKEHVQKLIDVHLKNDNKATFSDYDNGEIGVPAIFSREVFSELKNLKGDEGAKRLAFQHGFSFGKQRFEGGNFDIDTKEDVELLKKI